ncbi:MAG: dGTP triphosphohydrolase [Verrucomicrobiia bacterium]
MIASNSFYTPDDFERLDDNSKPDPVRSPFEVDRDRIIYTPAFRRLQAKTQVFMPGEYDFYRTRLTHSIETAQAGRAIANYLNRTSPHLAGDFFIDCDLVEATCLAHDLGHPPFGHAGERALNRLMQEYGGFEGNAQTARLLSSIIYGEGADRRGMNPTRALLDGVSKYKTLWHELPAHERASHFLYSDQAHLVDFLAKPWADARTHQSLECQIMDWADDTAYSLNDIVDGFHAGFITRTRVEEWASRRDLDARSEKLADELLEKLSRGGIDPFFGKKTGEFIRACSLEPRDDLTTACPPRYAFRLRVSPEVAQERDFYGRLAVDLVFQATPLQHLEHKSDHLLSALFRLLWTHHVESHRGLKLLPASTARMIDETSDVETRARLLCDYLAGMTDGFAIRTYKRLFDPDFGSITDLH